MPSQKKSPVAYFSIYSAQRVSYYRTAAGTELDLIVETGRKKIAFEMKSSSAPRVSKGFWHGINDVKADKAYIVAPVAERWSFADGVAG